MTRERCERKYPAGTGSVSTTVNTISTIRDTTIYVWVPGDTVFQWVAVSDTAVSSLNTPLAHSSAWIRDGRLNHRLEQRDTIISKTIEGALKTTITESQRKEILVKTEYINELTWWQWLQVYLGRVFIGLLVVIIAWRVMLGHRA